MMLSEKIINKSDNVCDYTVFDQMESVDYLKCSVSINEMKDQDCKQAHSARAYFFLPF